MTKPLYGLMIDSLGLLLARGASARPPGADDQPLDQSNNCFTKEHCSLYYFAKGKRVTLGLEELRKLDVEQVEALMPGLKDTLSRFRAMDASQGSKFAPEFVCNTKKVMDSLGVYITDASMPDPAQYANFDELGAATRLVVQKNQQQQKRRDAISLVAPQLEAILSPGPQGTPRI